MFSLNFEPFKVRYYKVVAIIKRSFLAKKEPITKSDFKSIVWVINNVPAHGYKLMYKNPEENIVAEFSIYNDKFKDMIIREHTKKFVLPFYISIILFIVKFFYYTVPILPKKTYQGIKRFLLSRGIGEELDKFIVLDSF